MPSSDDDWNLVRRHPMTAQKVGLICYQVRMSLEAEVMQIRRKFGREKKQMLRELKEKALRFLNPNASLINYFNPSQSVIG